MPDPTEEQPVEWCTCDLSEGIGSDPECPVHSTPPAVPPEAPPERCLSCEGTGYDGEGRSRIACPVCEGTGYGMSGLARPPAVPEAPEQAGKSEEGERCTCIEGNDHAVATSAINNCPVHGSSEEVREASERWVIPTCAECGALVVVEGGYDGTYNACSGCGRTDFYSDGPRVLSIREIEVVPLALRILIGRAEAAETQVQAYREQASGLSEAIFTAVEQLDAGKEAEAYTTLTEIINAGPLPSPTRGDDG